MAMIIRQYSQPKRNQQNDWPSNGLFTKCKDDVISRYWFCINAEKLPTLIGNVFELSNEMTLTVRIIATPNYVTHLSTHVDVCIENVEQEVMPLEAMERQSFINYLNRTINKELRVSDVAQVTIGCHAKGWFWPECEG